MKKIYLVFLILCPIILLSNHVIEGADWKRYGGTADTSCYYDSTSISHPSKITVRVWNKWVVNNKDGIKRRVEERVQINQSTKGYNNFKQSLMLVEIKCPTRELCVLSVADYDNREKVLDAYKYKECQWGQILPDSLIENLYKAVCPH
jgi:hypothetical protein